MEIPKLMLTAHKRCQCCSYLAHHELESVVIIMFLQALMWIHKGVPGMADWSGIGTDEQGHLNLVLDTVQAAIMVLQLISWLHWIVMHRTCVPFV